MDNSAVHDMKFQFMGIGVTIQFSTLQYLREAIHVFDIAVFTNAIGFLTQIS